MEFLKNLFMMTWFVSFIAFIVYWRKKVGAKKSAGESYKDDENYKNISKTKRIIGAICLASFVIGSAIPESQETKLARQAEQQQREIEKVAKAEQKAAKEAEKQEKAQMEAEEKAAKEANKYTEADINVLINDAQNNAAAANKNYKGKYVKIVGGAVFNIESNASFIQLEGSDPYTLIHITCRPKNNQVKNAMINLSNGQIVTVYGKITDVGEILGYQLDLDRVE